MGSKRGTVGGMVFDCFKLVKYLRALVHVCPGEWGIGTRKLTAYDPWIESKLHCKMLSHKVYPVLHVEVLPMSNREP